MGERSQNPFGKFSGSELTSQGRYRLYGHVDDMECMEFCYLPYYIIDLFEFTTCPRLGCSLANKVPQTYEQELQLGLKKLSP